MHDIRFGIKRDDSFEPLSNFILNVILEIDAGPRSGFLAEITDIQEGRERYHKVS